MSPRRAAAPPSRGSPCDCNDSRIVAASPLLVIVPQYAVPAATPRPSPRLHRHALRRCAGPSGCSANTSILHHAFISIFVALWVVTTHYVTILMHFSLLFYKVYTKRENASSWNFGLEKEQILETYSAQLQKS